MQQQIIERNKWIFRRLNIRGIKITTNSTNRSSYGNNVVRNNTDRDHPISYTTNGFIPNNSYMVNSGGITQHNGRK